MDMQLEGRQPTEQTHGHQDYITPTAAEYYRSLMHWMMIVIGGTVEKRNTP